MAQAWLLRHSRPARSVPHPKRPPECLVMRAARGLKAEVMAGHWAIRGKLGNRYPSGHHPALA
jgi:hypothetical protein